MIRFYCKNCNQNIKVGDNYAGKKGKCPKCKNMVVIPNPANPATGAVNEPDAIGQLQEIGRANELKITFKCQMCEADIDVSQSCAGQIVECPQCGCYAQSPEEETKFESGLPVLNDSHQTDAFNKRGSENNAFVEQMRTCHPNNRTNKEETPQWRLPWFIDLFLYPASASGLSILAIILFTPLIFELILFCLAQVLGPFRIMLMPLGICFLIADFIIAAYMFWYFGVCVQASSRGKRRAPGILNKDSDAGGGSMVNQMLRIIFCVLIFLAPSLGYYYNTKQTDSIFFSLLGGGAFFLPMALLAMIMFESIWGLNPILIIGSIIRTFFRYCLVVPAFYLVIAAIVGMVVYVPADSPLLVTIALMAVALYALLIAAHILGLFFHRNEEKLYWEV